MIRLLKAEIFKLFKDKTFKVVCIIAILFSILSAMAVSPIMKSNQQTTYNLNGDESTKKTEFTISRSESEQEKADQMKTWTIGFKLAAKDIMNPSALEVYHSAFGGGVIEILMGIFLASFFAKEYSNGTIKNILAYGKKRRDFYLAKFIAAIIAVAIITLALVLIATVATIIMNGWGRDFEVSDLIGMLSTFIVVVIANSAIISILMIVVIITKSNGATIAATVAGVVLTPTVLMFLYGVNPKFDKIYDLMPFVNSNIASSLNATNDELLQVVFVAIITISISLLLGIKVLEKQDIK